ncbi:hypothetical protein BdWA1_001386 [Babesia duncani]|uniref:SUEL-type lectin domain-containing protein n=1 Tax=Babesia duncani TaxID=323732 RepID=A0AAD9PP01_9APIC|nr:hypothetical protein BdWA1_001386 [Babesia duncani]
MLQDESIEITCPKLTHVLLQKAIIFNQLQNFNSDDNKVECLEALRNECLGKQQCLVTVTKCRASQKDKRLIKWNLGDELVIHYFCEIHTTPPPIYNGFKFNVGITSEYLVIPGQDDHFQLPGYSDAHMELVEACSKSPTCNYITYPNGQMHFGNL